MFLKSINHFKTNLMSLNGVNMLQSDIKETNVQCFDHT